MITLATIAVRFDIDVDRAKREQVANSAFDLAELAAREFLSVNDFGVDAVVERGSVDVFVTVVVAVSTLLTTLSAYGSAAEGFEKLKADIKSMKKYYVSALPHRAGLPGESFETSRLTIEELSKIGRFIRDVELGQLQPGEAAHLACAALERTDEPLDAETKRALEASFSAITPRRVESHRRSDALAVKADEQGSIVATRRRIPRLPTRRDHVRIWRNPGESERHREDS